MTVSAIAALVTLSGTVAADVADFREIVRINNAAPGTGGLFVDFDPPRMGSDGRVAFTAASNGFFGPTGIWATQIDDPQSLELIAMQNAPVPDGNGKLFAEFAPHVHTPIVGDDGIIGFSARVYGGGLPFQRFAALKSDNGVLESVALPGDVLPGLGGATLESLSTNIITMNRNGLMGFQMLLEGAGVNETNNRALGLTWFGGINTIQREGSPVPGMPGTTFGLPIGVPKISNTGEITFVSRLEGATDSNLSIWSGFPGLFDHVMDGTQVSPLALEFTDYSNPHRVVSVNSTGQTFYARVDFGGSELEAFWRNDGNVITPVIYETQIGPLGTYIDIDAEGGHTNTEGTSIVRAEIVSPGINETNDTAIVAIDADGTQRIVVQEGDWPYAMGHDVEFDDLIYVGGEFIDDAGRIYFEASVRGPGINNSNDRGVWAVDPDGTMHLVIRESGYIKLGDNLGRWVDHYSFISGSGTEDGRGVSINDMGQVTMHVTCTDGTVALVVATLPPDCEGDVNGDGVVDFNDLNMVLDAWDTTGPVGTAGDADLDGDTDFDDLNMVLDNWGHSCN